MTMNEAREIAGSIKIGYTFDFDTASQAFHRLHDGDKHSLSNAELRRIDLRLAKVIWDNIGKQRNVP